MAKCPRIQDTRMVGVSVWRQRSIMFTRAVIRLCTARLGLNPVEISLVTPALPWASALRLSRYIDGLAPGDDEVPDGGPGSAYVYDDVAAEMGVKALAKADGMAAATMPPTTALHVLEVSDPLARALDPNSLLSLANAVGSQASSVRQALQTTFASLAWRVDGLPAAEKARAARCVIKWHSRRSLGEGDVATRFFGLDPSTIPRHERDWAFDQSVAELAKDGLSTDVARLYPSEAVWCIRRMRDVSEVGRMGIVPLAATVSFAGALHRLVPTEAPAYSATVGRVIQRLRTSPTHDGLTRAVLWTPEHLKFEVDGPVVKRLCEEVLRRAAASIEAQLDPEAEATAVTAALASWEFLPADSKAGIASAVTAWCHAARPEAAATLHATSLAVTTLPNFTAVLNPRVLSRSEDREGAQWAVSLLRFASQGIGVLESLQAISATAADIVMDSGSAQEVCRLLPIVGGGIRPTSREARELSRACDLLQSSASMLPTAPAGRVWAMLAAARAPNAAALSLPEALARQLDRDLADAVCVDLHVAWAQLVAHAVPSMDVKRDLLARALNRVAQLLHTSGDALGRRHRRDVLSLLKQVQL
jgi:hypothetical protein